MTIGTRSYLREFINLKPKKIKPAYFLKSLLIMKVK